MKKKSTGAKAFFSEDGRRYILRDVHFMPAADSFLFNDMMFIQIDHRGRTGSTYGGSESPFFLQPNRTRYSEDVRCAYVRDDDTGDYWSAPYDPVQVEPDEFEFSPGIGDITWRNVTKGIAVDMRLFVPADETVEVWTVTVTNVSGKKRKVSVYPSFPMGYRSWLINKCRWEDRLGAFVYDLFPYYVTVEDYYNNLKLKNLIFCAADRKPTSYTADLDEFKGEGGLHNPDELSDKKLSRRYANFKSGAGIFQYALNLAPGRSATINFVFGPAGDTRDIRRLKRKFLTKGGIEKALAGVEKYHTSPSVQIETPDVEFNHFVNHWMPKQAFWIGRTLRSSFCPCARNAMTDTTGILYTDPKRARYWIKRIWSLQHKNGWIEHGLPFAEGVHMSLINTVPHRDMNAWGPMFVYYYLCETGDRARRFMNTSVPGLTGNSRTAQSAASRCSGRAIGATR
jgi:cellobionic acid phosphorylase